MRNDDMTRITCLLTSGLLLMAFTSGLALAQLSGGNFEITKITVDNGGGISSGGSFSLSGTIGQADASIQTSNGGSYLLAGGFWANVDAAREQIFADGFENL